MEKRIEEILSQLTLEEKVHLCCGFSCMEFGDLPRLGIGTLTMADGPQGIRLEDGRTATALPSGMNLAASFDPANAEKYGALIARECLANGVQVSLGPGFNLMRTPMNGRNFEYYGEDPVLAGKMAAGYIRGCQSEKVAAAPKHLVLNNQEICRTVSSSNCDEQTMRELYLRAFEIVVRESAPWMMMSSYNKINGTYASANRHVQQEIAKDEFKFDGCMVSDWGAVHDTAGCALGGLDLEMGSGLFRKELKDVVESGKVPEAALDEMVRRNLRLLYRTGRIAGTDFVPGTPECNTPRHRKFALDCAIEGTVLLKNKNNVLPLKKNALRRILVTGPNADYRHSVGALEHCGGSGAVHPDYEITPLAGVRELLGDSVEILYAPGAVFEDCEQISPALLQTPEGKPGVRISYFDSRDFSGTPFEVRVAPSFDLHWGEFGAAGRDNTDPLNKRTFCCRMECIVTPEKDETIRLTYKASRLAGKLKVDGVEQLCNNPCVVYPPQGGVALTVRKGVPVKIEVEMERYLVEFTEFSLLWIGSASDRIAQAAELARSADAVLFFGGRNHRYDREAIGWGDVPNADIGTWDLVAGQNELIGALCEANPCVICTFVNGSSFNAAPWIDQVPAMLDIFYGGMEAGRAVARILFGEAAPGGRLPFSWAEKLEDYSCHANGCYPGDRNEATAHTDYEERQFIGYRHFDRRKTKLLFPFGAGLNYGGEAEMKIAGVKKTENGGAEAEVVLRNPHSVRIKAVPQLYVAAEKCSAERPEKELGAFAAVWLEPGEEQKILLSLGFREFAQWDAGAGAFVQKPGKFRLLLNSNAATVLDETEIPFAGAESCC